MVLEIDKSQQEQDVLVARGGGAQCLQFLDGRRKLAEISAADRLQLPGLQVPGIERHHPRKQRERPRVVFLPR